MLIFNLKSIFISVFLFSSIFQIEAAPATDPQKEDTEALKTVDSKVIGENSDIQNVNVIDTNADKKVNSNEIGENPKIQNINVIDTNADKKIDSNVIDENPKIHNINVIDTNADKKVDDAGSKSDDKKSKDNKGNKNTDENQKDGNKKSDDEDENKIFSMTGRIEIPLVRYKFKVPSVIAQVLKINHHEHRNDDPFSSDRLTLQTPLGDVLVRDSKYDD